MSTEQAKRSSLPDPPASVADPDACEVVDLDGVRAVWLDRERSSNGTIVYVHGGSFVSGPYRSHWEHLDRLRSATAMAGLMIDYGLAPEHPFPAAPDDCVRAIAAATGSGSLRSGRWAIVGDGSGGGLALVVCFRLRDAGLSQPAALALISPEVDLALASPDVEARQRKDPMLTVEGPRRWNAEYVGDHDWRDPLVSPLHGDPTGLPPTLVQVGSTELLVPDARAWCERCDRAGVEVTYAEEPGGFHDFALASPRIPESRRAQSDQAAFIVSAIKVAESDAVPSG